MALTNVKIGITIGDKNGIGPEVILNSLKDNRILSGITPVIYGSEDVLKHYMSKLAMEGLVIKRISSADKAQAKTINVINVLDEKKVESLYKSIKILLTVFYSIYIL